MTLRRFVIACVALAAMGVMALSVQAQTPPPPTPSPAFERAYLSEMDAATRAEVEKRATAGNTISGVIATILLNNYQIGQPRQGGGADLGRRGRFRARRGRHPERTQPVRARAFRPEDAAAS